MPLVPLEEAAAMQDFRPPSWSVLRRHENALIESGQVWALRVTVRFNISLWPGQDFTAVPQMHLKAETVLNRAYANHTTIVGAGA